MTYDAVVIGSGFGGLTAGALLARYGRKVLVLESHSIPGGAGHSFVRQGFHFDSGPSFHCGLSDPKSLNPLRQVLALLGETIPAVPYDPFAHYHFERTTFPVYGNSQRYQSEIAKITPQGAKEYRRFEERMMPMYEALRSIPVLALRGDLGLLGTLLSSYLGATLKLLSLVGNLQSSAGQILDRDVRDPWVRRLVNLECFLLSGLSAHETVAPEVAFMLGERANSVVDYPLGGGGALVDALVRGLERFGGTLRLSSHVAEICLSSGRATGVRLKNGEVIPAKIVISNASLWDTYANLLPSQYQGQNLRTPMVDSFMHLHLGIDSQGLEGLSGHHVVIGSKELGDPGNTCMISIPSVWDSSLAPPGHHAVHVYSLEPFAAWQRDSNYAQRKLERAAPLYQALERVIPDLRSRIVLDLIGTPLTHARYLRRYRGTYGPARMAEIGKFPGLGTPIPGLYRVGDSTLPGIGVPAVVASAILCVNALVRPDETAKLVNLLRDLE
jgi:carotene isomerase